MVDIKEYEKDLEKLGNDYFVNELKYVSDISKWAGENDKALSEPHMPMKLIAETDDTLTMVIQSETGDEMISDVVKNLEIRWSVKDNVTDMSKKFSSTKKKLAYCFLKEYARSLQKIDGGELLEDEWVLEEMEYLGYFNE